MTNPLLLLCFPTLYVFGALFSLLQMQVIFTLIAKGVSQVKAISALEPVLPCEELSQNAVVVVEPSLDSCPHIRSRDGLERLHCQGLRVSRYSSRKILTDMGGNL